MVPTANRLFDAGPQMSVIPEMVPVVILVQTEATSHVVPSKYRTRSPSTNKLLELVPQIECAMPTFPNDANPAPLTDRNSPASPTRYTMLLANRAP